MLLRLPHEIKELFREWLVLNYPDRYRHVLSLVREMRGGKDYDAAWGKRHTGEGPYAWMIGRRFETACARLGLNRRTVKLRADLFVRPAARGEQLSLFGDLLPACAGTPAPRPGAAALPGGSHAVRNRR